MGWDFVYGGDVILSGLTDDDMRTVKAALITAITSEGDFLRLDANGTARYVLIDRGIPMYFRAQ